MNKFLLLYQFDRMSVLHQGQHATTDEITACAYQAVNVDNTYNGAPVQIRVVMGKEPRHFLAIFKGKLIIFEVRIPHRFMQILGADTWNYYFCKRQNMVFVILSPVP